MENRLIAAYSAACLLLFMVICFVSGGYEQEQLSKALAVDLDAAVHKNLWLILIFLVKIYSSTDAPSAPCFSIHFFNIMYIFQ